jgi:hypothetical protein
MAAVLPDPFYYLENFRYVLAWVTTRHADLLAAHERALLGALAALPRPAQALLVRMVMRKGTLFRQSKLAYAEIGESAPALSLLAENGFIDMQPALALEELFGLLRKEELQALFADELGGALRNARKDEMLEHLGARFGAPRPLAQWQPDFGDGVCRLLHADLYDRLRLMFFGNLHQGWSEFVLTELGLLKYEAVEISAASRAFQQRADVDAYLHLWECRERLEAGEDPRTVLADVPGFRHAARESRDTPCANPWIEERRARLLFHIGQALEREKDLSAALAVYQASSWPEARLRAIRVLEQRQEHEAALQLASELQGSSPHEEEQQQLARILPRLRRKLGLAKAPATALLAPERRDLALEPVEGWSVEWRVREHLHEAAAPVFYVENALINSLFGLLCWPAIFAPLPGAFFHAFHYGPVDLHSPDFQARRAQEFAQCFQLLESGGHREAILATFAEKYGTQSPFVFWEALSAELLTLALDCIPPAHLRALFTRLLADLKSNRSGFPDLIQFWPQEKRYLMLEVKGPGDRLQDNQIRWLDYCVRHGIPVAVSHVTWTGAA